LVAREQHALEEPIDRFAYGWMADQLRTRLGAADDAWPLWAWAKTTRRDLITDAGRYRRLAPGTVLVTFVVPGSRALLSGFDDWHAPLNKSPLWSLDGTLDELDAELDRWYDQADRVAPGHRQRTPDEWPAVLRDEVIATWSGIFDPARWTRRTYLQTCVAELCADDVVDAVRLVSR
jgi:hypothetical protein